HQATTNESANMGVTGEMQFVTEPSGVLFCPICQELCNDPVITQGCLPSRLCSDLHPNLALASLIQEVLYGCEYKGTAASVNLHLTNCPYEKIKGYIEFNEKRIIELQNQISEQSREISQLRNTSLIQPPTPTTLDGMTDILAGNSPEPLETWPFGDMQCRRTIAEHRTGVTSLCYHSGILYSGAYDGTIKVSNAESGQIVRSLKGHNMSVWALAVHAPTNRLFSAGSDADIKVWPMDEDVMDNVATLKNHSGKVYSLVINGNRLYSASSDRTIKIWDLQTLSCLATLAGHSDGVNSLTLANDKLISGASDRTVKIWDLSTAQCVSTIMDSSEVLDVTFGNNMLFTSTYDAHVNAFNLNDLGMVASMEGHNWEVWQVEYCSRGVLFSGSFDHTIKRWDIRNFQNTATLTGHKGFVHSLTI
ncbi:hypothetical protein HK096_005739, partial [Nowakowskiella sp. JEL0078]